MPRGPHCISDDDVLAIFLCFRHNKRPPRGLQFSIIMIPFITTNLSPPPIELLDGLYVLIRSDSKNSKSIVPRSLRDRITSLEQHDDLAHVSWQVGGRRKNGRMVRRLCTPRKTGCASSHSDKRCYLWTMTDTEKRGAQEDFQIRLIQVFSSSNSQSSFTANSSKRTKSPEFQANVKISSQTIGYNLRTMKNGYDNSNPGDGNITPVKGGTSLQAKHKKKSFQQYNKNELTKKIIPVSTFDRTNSAAHGCSQTRNNNHAGKKSSERNISSLHTPRSENNRVLQPEKTDNTPSTRKRKAHAAMVSPSPATASLSEQDLEIIDMHSAQCSPPKYLSLEDVQSIFSRFSHYEPPSGNLPFKIVLVTPPPAGLKISPPTRRFEDGIYLLLHAENRISAQINLSETYHVFSDEDLEHLPKTTWRLSDPCQVEKSHIISRRVHNSNTCDKAGTIYSNFSLSPGGKREEDLRVRIFHVFPAHSRSKKIAESPMKRIRIYWEKRNKYALRERCSVQSPTKNKEGQSAQRANGLAKLRNENTSMHACVESNDATKCNESYRQCKKDCGNNDTEIPFTNTKPSEISTPSSLQAIYSHAQNTNSNYNRHKDASDFSWTESTQNNQVCMEDKMQSCISAIDLTDKHVLNPPQLEVTEVDHTKRLSATDVKAIFDSVLEQAFPPPINFRIIIASNDDLSFIPPPLTLLDGVYVILRSQQNSIVRLPLGFENKLFAPTSEIHPCSWKSSGNVSNEAKFQKRRWIPKDCCSKYSACRRGELWTMRSNENIKYEIECRVFQVFRIPPGAKLCGNNALNDPMPEKCHDRHDELNCQVSNILSKQRKVRRNSFETCYPEWSDTCDKPVPGNNKKRAAPPQSEEVPIMGLNPGEELSSSASTSSQRSSRISDIEIYSIFQCFVENCTSPIEFKIIVLDPNSLSVSPPPYEFDAGVYVLLSAGKSARVTVPTKLAARRMKESDIKSLPFCKWSTSGPYRAKNSAFRLRHCSPAEQNINPKRGIIWNMIDENGNETSSCRIFQIYTSTSSKRRCIQRSLNGIGQHRGRTKRDEPKSHIDHSYAISNLAFLELQQSMVQLTDLIFLTSTKYTRETKTLHDSNKTTITTYHSPTHISGKSVLYHQESDDETSSPKDGKESLLSTRRANGEKITPGSEIFSNATNILCKQNDSIVANLSFDEMNHNVSVSATSFHSIDRQESETNSVNVSSTDASSMKEYQDCSSKSERSPAETTLNYSENPSPQRRDKLFPILFAIIVATFGMKLLISAFLLICIVFVFTIFALAALARIKHLDTELERAKGLHLRQMETLENHHIAEIQLCENEHDEFVSNLIQSHREEVESLHNLMVIYRETSVDTFQMFCNSEARQ